MKTILALVCLLGFLVNNDPDCYTARTSIKALQEKHTFVSDSVLERCWEKSFHDRDGKLTELSAYLNTLDLPDCITAAHVVFNKSLTLYEPTHTTHHSQPWYDGEGVIITPEGDESKLSPFENFEKNLPGVETKLIAWRQKHYWGPYVLYENEDRGKGVVDVNLFLVDKNGCLVNSVEIRFSSAAF